LQGRENRKPFIKKSFKPYSVLTPISSVRHKKVEEAKKILMKGSYGKDGS